MKASDLFVRCLEEEAIPFVIGVPGEENADMMMSLEDSSIDVHITRHEQGAVFAAAAYGKLTGQPAGCIGTLGPGATNMVTGVADANMDHAPVLAISGQGSTDRLHKESHQIMDVVAMFDPVTKWATTIRTAESIPEVIRKSIRLARGEKPGAVLVELPEDIAKRKTDAKPLTPRRYRRPTPNADTIQAAAELLATADRPMVLTGNGGIRTRASAELRSLAEAFGFPVVSTFMGKGAVSMDSEHCLFTVGIQQRDEIAQELIEADVVLAIGYDLVEYPPGNWVGNKTRIIHLDFLPAEIDASYHPEVELVGDVAAGLVQLRQLLEGKRGQHRHADRLARVRKSMLDEFAQHANDDTKGIIKPQKLLWDTRQALGPSDVLLSGVGAHKMWIGRHYQCIEPNTCLIPNGFCSMGQALPGLIGAKLARPDDHCVAICGDGDFLMNVQEMETITRMGLDVVAIVWEDKAYGLIEWKQEAEFGKHTDLSFGNPDWIGLGEAFGWRSERAENSADFLPALKRALDHRGPSLLVAPVDYRENMKLTERLGHQVCRI
ncbi:MAG: acetolactate synthase large subunit [Phycisphaerales bacterium]|jgi:acetolactate synthase-1/2/3 large subunit